MGAAHTPVTWPLSCAVSYIAILCIIVVAVHLNGSYVTRSRAAPFGEGILITRMVFGVSTHITGYGDIQRTAADSSPELFRINTLFTKPTSLRSHGHSRRRQFPRNLLSTPNQPPIRLTFHSHTLSPCPLQPLYTLLDQIQMICHRQFIPPPPPQAQQRSPSGSPTQPESP